MKIVPGALAAILAVAAAPPAVATTVLAVGVPEMTRTSEWVVRATVREVRPADLRSEGRGIFTDVVLDVTEVWRGESVPARTTLRLLGGKGADGMSTRVPGMPRFLPGEDVVLFLERTPLGHVPCGLGQGVWGVEADAQGRPWVRQRSGGVHRLRRAADGRLREAAPEDHTPLRLLDDLALEVYDALLAKP